MEGEDGARPVARRDLDGILQEWAESQAANAASSASAAIQAAQDIKKCSIQEPIGGKHQQQQRSKPASGAPPQSTTPGKAPAPEAASASSAGTAKGSTSDEVAILPAQKRRRRDPVGAAETVLASVAAIHAKSVDLFKKLHVASHVPQIPEIAVRK